MPFAGDAPIFPDILSGLNRGGKKVFNQQPMGGGTAPIHNQGLGDILNGIFAGTVPWWYGGSPVHGQGTMAPDSPKLVTKDWEQDPQASSSGNSLLDQLLQLAMGQGSGGDYSSQAQSAVNAQYDPQIAELRRQMEGAQGRADRGGKQIGDMYSSLSQSDLADIPIIDQMFGQSGQKLDQQYADLKNQVASQYSNAEQQQMDLMKKLNIQAAAPDALRQQQSDQAFLQGQQGQSHQDTTDAMKMLQTGADNFSRQGSEIARGEGANRQADLLSQLQDYMSQASGKIGDLNLAKQNAYQGALGQFQNQDYQHQQDMFTRLLEIAKLQQSGIQGSMGQAKAGPLAASQFLGENSSNPTDLNSFLMQVLQNPQITSGQTPQPNGRSANLTPEAAAQIAQQQAAAAGMSPESQQQLYMAMLAYYGRMY